MRPFVYFSASSLNLSAPLPLGVSGATTWLNLITIGAWACAPVRGRVSRAAPQSAAMSLFKGVLPCLLGVLSGFAPGRKLANDRKRLQRHAESFEKWNIACVESLP